MSGLRTSEPVVSEQGKAIPAAGITLPFGLDDDNGGRLLSMEASFCFQQSASGEVGKRAGMHGRDFYSGSPIFYAALKKIIGAWRRRCDSCVSYGKQGRKGFSYANQGRGLEEEQKKCRRNMKVPRWMSSSWKTATLLLRLVCLVALAVQAVLSRAMGKTSGSNPYSVMLYQTRAC